MTNTGGYARDYQYKLAGIYGGSGECVVDNPKEGTRTNHPELHP